MSILCCIHETQQIAMARALKRAFGVPVVCLVSWQYIEDNLGISEDHKREIGPFYSTPQHYFENKFRVDALSMEDLDREQEAVENRLGIRDNAMLVSYDRDFSHIHDYRKARTFQLLHLWLVETILEENDISFILAGRETYQWQVLADAALYRQIPSLSLTTARHVGNRIYGRDSRARQLGMPETFAELMQGESKMSQDDVEEADRMYDAFIDSPNRPNYAVKNTRSLKRSIMDLLFYGYKSLYRSYVLWENNEYDRESGRLDSVVESVMAWPAKAVRMSMVRYSDYLLRSPDLSQRYVYLPLHRQPEVTDMYYGRDYSHHEGFIADLSKRLPSSIRLFVKDHTSMVGRRPLGFYKNLKKLYNVDVVSPYVSTFDLIASAEATITVTGTAGWEAYLMNKPSIALGNCFYNFLPGVLKADLRDDDFIVKLNGYIMGFAPDANERRAAFRAHYACSYDIGVNYRDMNARVSQAERYAEIVKEIADRWGCWLVENEPQSRAGRGGG
ncbi:hypothetical protein [Pseudodesulfovibrio pelocollis]|uniref:capsular polysaccharide export protein, LipB/KpsS family n=1 Tax=Pseudodesulfovibrio pelocollis TaxID=3051432 RepID=UPI00255A7C13|nr:hypothetical protein [Pseudodesulfovibrio sp. SB368]